MKKIICLLFISCFALSVSFAQRKINISKVPQEVIKNYNLKFTDIKKVIWRKVNMLYEAEVFIGNALMKKIVQWRKDIHKDDGSNDGQQEGFDEEIGNIEHENEKNGQRIFGVLCNVDGNHLFE